MPQAHSTVFTSHCDRCCRGAALDAAGARGKGELAQPEGGALRRGPGQWCVRGEGFGQRQVAPMEVLRSGRPPWRERVSVGLVTGGVAAQGEGFSLAPLEL